MAIVIADSLIIISTIIILKLIIIILITSLINCPNLIIILKPYCISSNSIVIISVSTINFPLITSTIIIIIVISIIATNLISIIGPIIIFTTITIANLVAISDFVGTSLITTISIERWRKSIFFFLIAPFLVSSI